jgi:signal transduction histidine kinase
LKVSAPQVVIEDVWVDGEKLFDMVSGGQAVALASSTATGAAPSGNRLEIHSGYKHFEIHYTAPNFTAPEKVRFRYRLDGLDTDWVEAGENRTAWFGKLPPGDYRFRVIACNNDGVWNEHSAALAFTLRPHFWQRRWFLAVNLIVAGAMVGGAIRLRERRKTRQAMMRLERQHAVEKERHRIAQDMHDELGSRLAKLSYLCELAKGSVARPTELNQRIGTIANISQAVLATLDEIVWVVNPHNDTLEHLAAYIGDYAKQFFQTMPIDCEVQMPVALPALPLAAETRHHLFLAVQEALSNIIKHACATHVRVVMAQHDDCFRISVEDNGRGFPMARLAGPDGNTQASSASPNQRNGLANMRRRLEEIGAQLHIQSRQAGGTQVTFELPLSPAKRRKGPEPHAQA